MTLANFSIAPIPRYRYLQPGSERGARAVRLRASARLPKIREMLFKTVDPLLVVVDGRLLFSPLRLHQTQPYTVKL